MTLRSRIAEGARTPYWLALFVFAYIGTANWLDILRGPFA